MTQKKFIIKKTNGTTTIINGNKTINIKKAKKIFVSKNFFDPAKYLHECAKLFEECRNIENNIVYIYFRDSKFGCVINKMYFPDVPKNLKFWTGFIFDNNVANQCVESFSLYDSVCGIIVHLLRSQNFKYHLNIYENDHCENDEFKDICSDSDSESSEPDEHDTKDSFVDYYEPNINVEPRLDFDIMECMWSITNIIFFSLCVTIFIHTYL